MFISLRYVTILAGDTLLKISIYDVTFNIFWRDVSNDGHSERKCLTVNGWLQGLHIGLFSLFKRCEWVIRVWPILHLVMTTWSFRQLRFSVGLPRVGLICSNLFSVAFSHIVCHFVFYFISYYRFKVTRRDFHNWLIWF